MRHNPAAGDIVIMLRSKKRIAQALSELTEQAYPDFEGALPILSKLLYTETADQEFRSTAHQLTAAQLTCYPNLPNFDLVTSEVNEALDLQLHPCEFSKEGQNASLVGGLSVDKRHLATAIGVRAIEHLKNKGKISYPDECLTFKPSSTRVSPQW